MALVNRVARLFKADFNAVLDQIEEPEQLLKQAIRDMEDELADNEQRVAICAHDQETLNTRRNELNSSLDELGDQLDLCFDSGKDDLAKTLIRKKLEAERIQKKLASKFDNNQRFLAEHRTLLDENRATLESLRQKAELVSRGSPGRDAGSDYDDIGWMTRDLRIGEEEVEIAYLREKAARGAA
ncbi:MAG: PspA/IM30 family protein [Woeseiaceae bacterium]